MSDNVELSIQQFVDAWDVLCAAAPGYLRHSESGVEYVFSGVPISFFNAAILTGSGLTADSLQVLAEQSGGEVFTPSNDIAAQLSRCVSDVDAFYTLTLDAAPPDKPNQYHALTVKTAPPGLTARTRSGYYSQP